MTHKQEPKETEAKPATGITATTYLNQKDGRRPHDPRLPTPSAQVQHVVEGKNPSLEK